MTMSFYSIKKFNDHVNQKKFIRTFKISNNSNPAMDNYYYHSSL